MLFDGAVRARQVRWWRIVWAGHGVPGSLLISWPLKSTGSVCCRDCWGLDVNRLPFAIIAINNNDMTVEPSIQVFINQLFGEATSSPEAKSVDAPIGIYIESRLLVCSVMPSQAFLS